MFGREEIALAEDPHPALDIGSFGLLVSIKFGGTACITGFKPCSPENIRPHLAQNDAEISISSAQAGQNAIGYRVGVIAKTAILKVIAALFRGCESLGNTRISTSKTENACFCLWPTRAHCNTKSASKIEASTDLNYSCVTWSILQPKYDCYRNSSSPVRICVIQRIIRLSRTQCATTP